MESFHRRLENVKWWFGIEVKEKEGCLLCLLRKTNPLKGDISHRNITSSKPTNEDIFFKMNTEISLNLGLKSKWKLCLSHRRFTYPPTTHGKIFYTLGWNFSLLNLLAFAQLTMTHAPASLQPCLELPHLCNSTVEPISCCNPLMTHFWMCQLSHSHIMSTWWTASPVYDLSTQDALMILKTDVMGSYVKLYPAPGNGERMSPSWGLSLSPFLLCLYTFSMFTSL